MTYLLHSCFHRLDISSYEALGGLSLTMPHNDFDYEDLTKNLTENFNILADEVQVFSDRNTILEHKLRFAAEKVSR